ncbi:hypothetical protein RBB50_005451 [Rhinocladiella similis]
MSLNWVMLDPENKFVPLPEERTLYSSASRTGLSIPALNIKSDSGVAYLTNQRLIYLPDAPTTRMQSFSAPLLNIYDARPAMPAVGPNAWLANFRPVAGGNIPDNGRFILINLSFKNGGALTFHYKFEQIAERLRQVVSTARENNTPEERQDRVLSGVNVANVHLDQLPSYEESALDQLASDGALEQLLAGTPRSPHLETENGDDEGTTGRQSPPDYPETTMGAIFRRFF